MNLVRLEPFHEMVSLRHAVNRLLEDNFSRPFRLAPVNGEGLTLAVDMYETDNEVVVKALLPGVKPEDLDINIADNILTIKGEMKTEQETKQASYLHRECHYGAFSRSMVLPAGLNIDKAESDLGNGILILTIPKVEEAKPKVIKVKAKQGTESKKAENKN